MKVMMKVAMELKMKCCYPYPSHYESLFKSK
jgi:hypothetical protein